MGTLIQRLFLTTLLVFLSFVSPSKIVEAQGFRRPDPARGVGRPPAAPAAPVDIFADIRRMESDALAIQQDILQLNGEIHQCMDQELERIAREEAARQQVQRDGRNIARRAVDFLLGRNRQQPPVGRGGAPGAGAGARPGGARDPEPVLPTSCLTMLGAQADSKRTQLRNLETRIATAFTNLYTANRLNGRQTASIALHQFASCVRQEAFPTRTMIPALQTDSSCSGGIVEDQLLFTYADHFTASRFPQAFDIMGRYSNQLQCQSELQAVLFNHAVGTCLERITVPDNAKCDYDAGIFHPALNAADAVLYTNPKTFQWVEEHRQELIQCLPGSKLAATGYWCHDLKSGQMKQWQLCQQGGGTGSPACEFGADFIWSLEGENMGMGDCTMCELLAKGPIQGRGYVCDGKICRERDEPSETPFRLLRAEVEQAICNHRDERVPGFVPEGCGVNIIQNNIPRSGNNVFNCPETEASGAYLGVRDTPGCIAGGEGGGEDAPVRYEDGEPVYEAFVRAPAPKDEPAQSPADHGPRDREATPVSQETYNQMRENTARFMEHPDSPWRRTADSAVTALGYAHPTEEAFRQAIWATRGALYRPMQSGFCHEDALACTSGVFGRDNGLYERYCAGGVCANWQGMVYETFFVISCLQEDLAHCNDNLMHEAIHLVISYMRLERAREIVMARYRRDPLGSNRGPVIWDDFWHENTLMIHRDNPSLVMSGPDGWRDPEHRAMIGDDPDFLIPLRSCGEDDCSTSCTPGLEQLTAIADCIRGHPAPAPRGCPSGQDPASGLCVDSGGYLGPESFGSQCFLSSLIGQSASPDCRAVNCGENQFAYPGAGGSCCRTPGSGGGGGRPPDCNNDVGPRDPRCRLGNGAGGGPAGPGGDPSNRFSPNGRGGTPVIPGGGNPAESPQH